MTEKVNSFQKEMTQSELVDKKLNDAMVPGFVVPMDPDEAEMAGAFEETAMSLEDALESSNDIDLD